MSPTIVPTSHLPFFFLPYAEMRPTGGDTKTELAFQLAKKVLTAGRKDSLKFTFLITDGHPDDDTEALQAANDLRRAVRPSSPWPPSL